MALQEICTGKSKFTEEEIDEIDVEAPNLIPNCVATILHQSRPELAGTVSANFPGMPHKAALGPDGTIHAHADQAASTSSAVAGIEKYEFRSGSAAL